MCGFLFEASFSPTNLEVFKNLLNLGIHRGPDSQGVWSDENVTMGFNRLAILDLSESGNQPMHSSSGRWAICFNGEIYNHLELRSQIKVSKENWRGSSDTETILACIEEWGVEKTIRKLDGMFAIVLWDKFNKEVFLVRDFAGIKPLYYGWNGTQIVAASQYNQVVKHPFFSKEPVDQSVLKLYLQQHFIPPPFGLYRHTHQVEPGQIIKIDQRGKLKSNQYWSFPEWYQPTFFEQKDAIHYIESELENSVKAQLLSDVPLGAFLSSGVDSPLLCSFASQLQSNIKTFTIGSDSPVHDENIGAQKFAHLLGTNHHFEKMTAKTARNLWTEISKINHEPMADFSLIPTYLVSKLAREHVKVALSGDGGDELFFGYERFHSVAKNIRFQGLPWPLRASLYKADKIMTGNRRINSAVLSDSQGEAHQALHSRFPRHLEEKIFPELRSVSLPDKFNIYSYPKQSSLPHLLQQMRKAEFYGMMQKTLRKVDLASMQNSLEVRVPFLKKSILEASLKLDPTLSHSANGGKQVLRQLLHKRVPLAQRAGTKKGFSVPLGRWFREDLKEDVVTKLNQSHLSHHYGINKREVEQLLTDHNNGIDYKWPIFTLLSLNSWQDNLNH